MSLIWFKALTMIDNRSKVLQGRNATIDIEVRNIDGLISDLESLKSKWNSSRMQSEMFENHTVARQVRKKRRKRFSDESDVSDESKEDEADYHNDAYEPFRLQVFEVIIESLLKEMKNRYDVVRSLEAKLAFLIMEEEAITKQSLSFAEEYVVNVSGDLVSEIIYPRYYPYYIIPIRSSKLPCRTKI